MVDGQSRTIRDTVTVTRMFPTGAVTAMLNYNEGYSFQWCIVVFPNIEAAEQFADDNHMDYIVTPEVTMFIQNRGQ